MAIGELYFPRAILAGHRDTADLTRCKSKAGPLSTCWVCTTSTYAVTSCIFIFTVHGLEYIASYLGKSNMEILTEQRREREERLHESSAARPSSNSI